MSDKKKSNLKGKIKNKVAPVKGLPSMKATDTPTPEVVKEQAEPKPKAIRRGGHIKRIPENWVNHLIKINPKTKERLKTAVAHAQYVKDKKNDLQNFFIENALNEYLAKYEKKYNK